MQALQMKGYLLRQLVKWESERNDDTLKKTALSRAYIVEERQPKKHQLFDINIHTCCPIEIEKVKVDCIINWRKPRLSRIVLTYTVVA